MAERRQVLSNNFDHLRRAIILEPRGADVLVGALVTEPPEDVEADAGVIFFNNTGMLGMCGHGTMCVARALNHLGRKPMADLYRLATPVGIVEARLLEDGWVEVQNVPSYRRDVGVTVPIDGGVEGEVAWGGNWFFITHHSPCPVDLSHIRELTDWTNAVRDWLNANGYPEVDHIEVCVPSPTADSRNFVLCPGGAYDRSPCGTGTSAHMACLFASAELAEGQEWRQESVIGSLFRGRVRAEGDHVIPTIAGQAFVTGELTMILDPCDPFRFGIL